MMKNNKTDKPITLSTMHGRWALHEKAGSLEQTIMLRKIEGSRGRGSPNMRRIGSIKEAKSMSLQEPSRPMRTSLIHYGHHSFIMDTTHS